MDNMFERVVRKTAELRPEKPEFSERDANQLRLWKAAAKQNRFGQTEARTRRLVGA